MVICHDGFDGIRGCGSDSNKNSFGFRSCKALPAFHAFTGADNTGRFTGIGKVTWLNMYLKADDHLIKAMYCIRYLKPVK